MIRCKRKGITLSEICIVLAVVSIVSLAVVSFAAMATGRGATGTDKLKVMQDIELLEAMVDNWFNEVYVFDENNTLVRPEVVGENSNVLAVGDKKLWLENGNLYTRFSTEDIRTYRFETVTKLAFEQMKAESGDIIYFCTVTYAYRRGQNTPVEETYTFCINPRVGESITK